MSETAALVLGTAGPRPLETRVEGPDVSLEARAQVACRSGEQPVLVAGIGKREGDVARYALATRKRSAVKNDGLPELVPRIVAPRKEFGEAVTNFGTWVAGVSPR